MSAAAQMPRVSMRKKITSSKDDLTGFLNLTIDRAPIMPRERAIFFEITLVIAKVMIGKRTRVIVPENVFIQFCWWMPTDVLVSSEKKINTIEKNILEQPQKSRVEITNFVKGEMETELRLGGSWHNFATQLYYHLKCGFTLYYPLFEELEDKEFLNKYVNYSDNWFLGGKFRSTPMLQNYIVAIDANDSNHLQIMEEKVLEVIEDEVLRKKYEKELCKLNTSR